jgi:AcrR family transcriptional regulator
MKRRDAHQNEAKILAAFQRLRRRHPDTVPTMTEVVAESGLGRGTVYRHFPDIGSLVFAHLDRSYAQTFARWRAVFGAPDTQPRDCGRIIRFLNEMRAIAVDNLPILLDPRAQTSAGYHRARVSLRELLHLALGGAESPDARHAATVDLLARLAEAEHLALTKGRSEGIPREVDNGLVEALIAATPAAPRGESIERPRRNTT